MTKIKTYTDLSKIDSFMDRYRYLRIGGSVGGETFGYDRWVNQRFYTSRQWKLIRDYVITRDLGCDLGIPDMEIGGKILVHHMNPLTVEDLQNGNEAVLDPEFLITVSHGTHNAIHYGDERLLDKAFEPRSPGDTSLW